VSIAWQPSVGLQRLTVELDPDRAVAESDKSNNATTREIGRPPAPRFLAASRVGDSGRVLLTWQAPVTGGITGYRVYRASASSGPYELIALSWSAVFEEWVNPQRGQASYYVVTAYNQAGIESDRSREAFAAAWEGQRVFLPIVLK
jgi:fibronectin type 3 domain-containing protein